MVAKVYNKDIHPTLVKEIMSTGLSYRALAGKIGVSQQCVLNWIENYPEFKEAIEEGAAAREAYFEEAGLDLMTGKMCKGNGRVWELWMKNSFGMKDKIETEHSGNLNVEQSIAVIFVDEDSDTE